ncbi:MAG TPA: glycosyltransferase [bacterium]|nr:glycosyltransferase [bacterium]HNB10107.1 glycosyltransferase [bacterium]HNM16022.1 glycosyltransferase [bacterium]
MDFFDLFLWYSAGLYFFGLTVLAIGFCLYKPRRASSYNPLVSVVIAARNEEVNIDRCLAALSEQTYPADRMEIIVVNDRSTDGTENVVQTWSKKIPHLKIVSIREASKSMAPKKFAVDSGIRNSKGEIILCTDADCRPERAWVATMIEHFTPEVGMVLGYSPLWPVHPNSLFENFVACESIGLGVVAASTTALHKPWTVTGRSWGYRRGVYDEVGGFTKIALQVSGDDDLLLGLMKITKWKTAYAIGEQANVRTDPPKSINHFRNQKTRQLSKTRLYSFKMQISVMWYYLFNVALIVSLFFAVLYSEQWRTVVWAWSLKMFSDVIFLSAGAYRFRVLLFLKYYPFLVLIHPVYVLTFGLLGRFGRYTWKDTPVAQGEARS